MPKYFFSVVFIAAYPILVHASVILARPALQTVALLFFLLGLFANALARGRLLAWLIVSGLSLAVIVLGYFSLTLYLLYLPPIIIPLGLLYVFGRTLIAGRKPLITAIGEASRGPMPTSMQHYTRLLTKLWCLIFLFIIFTSTILLWMHQLELWSWFTNVINYGLIGGFVVIEFALRKKLFPDYQHPGFMQYIRIIIQSNIRH